MKRGTKPNQISAEQSKPSPGRQEPAAAGPLAGGGSSQAAKKPRRAWPGRTQPAPQKLDYAFNCSDFDVYRPGGRSNPFALLALFALSALAGAALAWPQAWFNYSGYVLSGSRLLGSFLIWSFLTGCLVMQGTKLLRVRRPGPALAVAALGALLAWAASWPAIHYFSGSSLTWLDFLMRRFEGGVVVDIDHIFRRGPYGGPDYRLFKAYHLLGWWLAGAALYCLPVGKMAALQAGRPFSETSGRWYSKIKLSRLKLERADLETLTRLPKGEVPDFLVNLDNYAKTRSPRFLVANWVKITIFQDPDWQRPFINVQIPVGLSAPYKLRHYRITLEEADILMEKFK